MTVCFTAQFPLVFLHFLPHKRGGHATKAAAKHPSALPRCRIPDAASVREFLSSSSSTRPTPFSGSAAGSPPPCQVTSGFPPPLPPPIPPIDRASGPRAGRRRIPDNPTAGTRTIAGVQAAATQCHGLQASLRYLLPPRYQDGLDKGGKPRPLRVGGKPSVERGGEGLKSL